MQVKQVELSKLKPHPKNYREHPEDQLAHIKKSIEEHGFYRNVVIAKDNTVLAGHGVVQACKELGWEKIPATKLDIDSDSTAALKVLTGDNYLAHFSEDDDRLLTEVLKQINDDDELFGTGFDEMMLANLVMVTRSEGELEGSDAAAEWVGMPEFETKEAPPQLVIAFENEEERASVIAELGWKVIAKNRKTWSLNWGQMEKNDVGSIAFTDRQEDEVDEETPV